MIYAWLKVGHVLPATYGATTKHNAPTVDLVIGTGWLEMSDRKVTAMRLFKEKFVPYAHIPDMVEAMGQDTQLHHLDWTSFYPHFDNDEHRPNTATPTGETRPSPVVKSGAQETVCERCGENLTDNLTHEHLDEPPKRHLEHGLVPDEDYQNEVNKWENRHRCPDGVSPWDLFVEQGRSQEGRALEDAQGEQYHREMEMEG